MKRLVLFSLLACASTRRAPAPAPAPPTPSVLTDVAPVSPWPGVLREAMQAAESGDYARADRLLAEWGLAHPKSPEGAEADFYRALWKIDPANKGPTIREQLAFVDAYLNGGPSQPHYQEAWVLRRLAETADSLRGVVDAVRSTQETRTRVKDDEIRRLTDMLEKTTAELERIKRRLAKP